MDSNVIERLNGILSKDRVLTKKADLVTYSYDATADVMTVMPDVVVLPKTVEEIVKIVKLADETNTPIYPRGSGTNLSGGAIPVKKGIVLCTQLMNKIIEIDPDNLTATVEPGVIVNDLNNAIAPHGLIYPPDPGTVATATIGGTVATCAGGLRGLKYGVTKHYVMGMQVVLPDASVVRFGGKTVKNVTAYDFAALFVGSEGTLGIVTEITVKLIPAPKYRRSMLALFKDLKDAGNTVQGIIKQRVIPATLEIMDAMTIETVENYAKVGLPQGYSALLLIEVDGMSKESVESEAMAVKDVVTQNNGELKIAETDAERDKIWSARRAALPALAQLSPTTVLEDATVPRSRLTEMLLEVDKIAKKYNLKIGTFGHAGDGNLHPTILADERNKEEMERVHKAVDEIFAAALKLGGTLSGEHGIGIAKLKYLKDEIGDSGIALMRNIKTAIDPKGIMNPGKLVP
ncbi:MAG: FAD-binding protein [Thermodesulfovibrionales bacterium]|nr:FAD-binding protein [Thermodesulfovibrionales bacterium]